MVLMLLFLFLSQSECWDGKGEEVPRNSAETQAGRPGKGAGKRSGRSEGRGGTPAHANVPSSRSGRQIINELKLARENNSMSVTPEIDFFSTILQVDTYNHEWTTYIYNTYIHTYIQNITMIMAMVHVCALGWQLWGIGFMLKGRKINLALMSYEGSLCQQPTCW